MAKKKGLPCPPQTERILREAGWTCRNGWWFHPKQPKAARGWWNANYIEQKGWCQSAKQTHVNVTDFDAIAIGNLLAMLADRHTDSEILSMLKPKKVRAALGVVRAAQQQKGDK